MNAIDKILQVLRTEIETNTGKWILGLKTDTLGKQIWDITNTISFQTNYVIGFQSVTNETVLFKMGVAR